MHAQIIPTNISHMLEKRVSVTTEQAGANNRLRDINRNEGVNCIYGVAEDISIVDTARRAYAGPGHRQ